MAAKLADTLFALTLLNPFFLFLFFSILFAFPLFPLTFCISKFADTLIALPLFPLLFLPNLPFKVKAAV